MSQPLQKHPTLVKVPLMYIYHKCRLLWSTLLQQATQSKGPLRCIYCDHQQLWNNHLQHESEQNLSFYTIQAEGQYFKKKTIQDKVCQCEFSPLFIF